MSSMTTAGLEPATFWCRLAIEAKRATIALGSHITQFNHEQLHIFSLIAITFYIAFTEFQLIEFST